MRECKAVEIRRIRFDIVKAILEEDDLVARRVRAYLA
jgi:hypothetical protein